MNESKIAYHEQMIDSLKHDLAQVKTMTAWTLISDEILFHKRQLKWEKQDHPCSGSGFSHGPHGVCSGYSTDRT